MASGKMQLDSFLALLKGDRDDVLKISQTTTSTDHLGFGENVGAGSLGLGWAWNLNPNEFLASADIAGPVVVLNWKVLN